MHGNIILIIRNQITLNPLLIFQIPMIEVYGQHEEYLSTVRGEYLDEIEGSSLYECRIDLKKLQSEVLLKVKCKYESKI